VSLLFDCFGCHLLQHFIGVVFLGFHRTLLCPYITISVVM
jgi:hypothetical protein